MRPLATRVIDWTERGDIRPGATFRLAGHVGCSITRTSDARQVPQQRRNAIRHRGESADRPTPVARQPEERSAPRLLPSRTAAPTPARAFPATPPDAAQLAAREAARSATSIDDLAAQLAAFDGCALKATAKSLCFYRGAALARVMVIGEAPGADEDKLGKPFVGPAGQLLDKMLASVALDEAKVHITNIVYWRPPGNRTPTPQEAQVCRPFLERQVELVKPDVIIVLGWAVPRSTFSTSPRASCDSEGTGAMSPSALIRREGDRDAASSLSAAHADRQAHGVA